MFGLALMIPALVKQSGHPHGMMKLQWFVLMARAGKRLETRRVSNWRTWRYAVCCLRCEVCALSNFSESICMLARHTHVLLSASETAAELVYVFIFSVHFDVLMLKALHTSMLQQHMLRRREPDRGSRARQSEPCGSATKALVPECGRRACLLSID